MWELSSDWLDCSSDLDIDVDNIEKIKLQAIDELKCACEEHISWYKGQIEMLNELIKEGE